MSLTCLMSVPCSAQTLTDTTRTDNLPVDKGILSLSSATITLSNGNLQIVFIPLDERVLRLVTKDSYRSMERLLDQQRRHGTRFDGDVR